ncbi:hypothetical protein APY03_3186 [Variovorax sp. WDL1]|nr:hypothetical protein APY03_3186 [Variovorax sp. WDL1]
MGDEQKPPALVDTAKHALFNPSALIRRRDIGRTWQRVSLHLVAAALTASAMLVGIPAMAMMASRHQT